MEAKPQARAMLMEAKQASEYQEQVSRPPVDSAHVPLLDVTGAKKKKKKKKLKKRFFFHVLVAPLDALCFSLSWVAHVVVVRSTSRPEWRNWADLLRWPKKKNKKSQTIKSRKCKITSDRVVRTIKSWFWFQVFRRCRHNGSASLIWTSGVTTCTRVTWSFLILFFFFFFFSRCFYLREVTVT